MTVQAEAAYHEAAHAVLAHLSLFFTLAGSVSVQNAGTGFADVGPSRRKLAARSKPTDVSVENDPEVMTELAVILFAGMEGEIIAEERIPGLQADVDRSEPDIAFALEKLEAANVSSELDVFRADARERLEANWGKVEKLAQQLLARRSMLANEVAELVDEA